MCVCFRLATLPEPVHRERWCSARACSQFLACCVVRQQEQPRGQRLVDVLAADYLQPLADNHVAFFVKWSRLLLLEKEASCGQLVTKRIFGDAEATVQLTQCSTGPRCSTDSKCLLNFRYCKEQAQPADFSLGEVLVVSSADRLHLCLCMGAVTQLHETGLCLTTDRMLPSGAWYRLDRHESSTSHNTAMANLVQLMQPDSQLSERLRALLVDGVAPRFEATLPKSTIRALRPLLSGSNAAQRAVVLRLLQARDYILLRGYPGTGKSTTLATCVAACAALGWRVLITGHTHNSVDNLMSQVRRGFSTAAAAAIGSSWTGGCRPSGLPFGCGGGWRLRG